MEHKYTKVGKAFSVCEKAAGFTSHAKLTEEIIKLCPDFKGKERTISKQISKYSTGENLPRTTTEDNSDSYFDVIHDIFDEKCPSECNLLDKEIENAEYIREIEQNPWRQSYIPEDIDIDETNGIKRTFYDFISTLPNGIFRIDKRESSVLQVPR